MEVGEADALLVQPVEVRRLDDRVAVAGEIAVALVVGHDQDDVGTLRQPRFRGTERTARSNNEAGDQDEFYDRLHGPTIADRQARSRDACVLRGRWTNRHSGGSELILAESVVANGPAWAR